MPGEQVGRRYLLRDCLCRHRFRPTDVCCCETAYVGIGSDLLLMSVVRLLM